MVHIWHDHCRKRQSLQPRWQETLRVGLVVMDIHIVCVCTAHRIDNQRIVQRN